MFGSEKKRGKLLNNNLLIKELIEKKMIQIIILANKEQNLIQIRILPFDFKKKQPIKRSPRCEKGFLELLRLSSTCWHTKSECSNMELD